MMLRVSLLLTILACLTFTPAAVTNKLTPPTTTVEAVENVPDPPPSTSSFYSFRRDLRKCASPRCGGYFVKLVNERRTRCADKKFAAECYVADIKWGGQTEPDNDRALLRGKLQTQGNRNGRYGVLLVSEVWKPATDSAPQGMFFRVRDRGLRCIAAPCPTHHEARLNSLINRNIAGVDLSAVGASDSFMSEATAAMTSADGILVSGDHAPVTGPAGRSQMLKASQFYVRAAGSSSSLKPCKRTGCSSQVCSDQDVITTCEYKTEYACYQKAACERQANGDCGFTQTPELTACLRRSR